MTMTIEVEIDDSGTVRPMDPTASLPRGRARLVWQPETTLDPVSRAIANAPLDDEPESADERRAVAESKAWLAAHPGQTISHAEIMAEFESMRRSQPSPRPSRMVIADNGLAFFPANGRVLTPEMVKAAQEDEID
ncbi:hypothetical protein [Granulicella aggregans]|uniref:hypothetical protein n=1 Tax=Granulicella aggregans TaxID=474949 RepID=UPI0021DF7899|nr:hypothetical protein [Granulicella aggregans]